MQLVLYRIRKGALLFNTGKAYETHPEVVDAAMGRAVHVLENSNLWILVDSSAFPEGIPGYCMSWDGIVPKLVYATSPDKNRKPKLEHNLRNLTVIMDI